MDRQAICLLGWNLMAILARKIINISGVLRPDIDNIENKMYLKWEKDAESVIPYDCEYDGWKEIDFENINKYAEQESSPYRLYVLLCRLCNQWQVENTLDCIRDEFSSLNDNVQETRIIVFPKLKCGWEKEDNRRRFTQYSIIEEEKLEGCKVLHHILSPLILAKKEKLRIAFSPIGKIDALDVEPFKSKDEYGIEHNYIKPRIKSESKKEIEELTECALRCAAKHKANIFFAPELLCADNCVVISKLEEEEYGEWIKMQYFALIDSELEPPSICILPELKDDHNSMVVFNDEARLIARQEKHYSYVDKTNNVKEWLPPHEKLVHLFHIRNGGRFCVMICADFLEDTYRRTIAEELDVSLILVPSYSKGVTAFIDAVPSELFNGTYVLWGNTCDVTYLYEGKKAEFLNPVGCLAISRNRKVELLEMKPPRFEEPSDCCIDCQREKGVCMYIVDIPLVNDQEARCCHISKMTSET